MKETPIYDQLVTEIPDPRQLSAPIAPADPDRKANKKDADDNVATD